MSSSSLASSTSTPPTTANLQQKKSFENLVQVKDYVPVGKPEILHSPHVSEGPGRIANSPVPSVYQDDRGEIHRLRVGGSRMNLLFSKKGIMRSGYLHPHSMNDFVVSGKVQVWTLSEVGTDKKEYSKNEFVTLAPYTPHILYFLEDTVLLEFWEGPFSCYYYHPYRRLVQLQNSIEERTSTTRSMGLLTHLVPQDVPQASTGSLQSLMWWSAGMIMGFALGTYVAGAPDRRTRL